MTKQLHQTIARWFVGLLFAAGLFGPGAHAATLVGTYTIDATQPATTTNFQNLTSAIAFLSGVGSRTDGGTANSAPYGVSGQVIFNFAAGTGPYNDQTIIPVIPGASPTNNIIINGNGCTMQFNTATSGAYHIIRLNGADHITINGLGIKPTNVSQGWGIHFMGGADSNKVIGCRIDLTAITTANTNSAGIVFSGTTTSVTSTGVNGYSNLIMNDTILCPATTAGSYYMIVNMQSSSAIYSGNKFIGNVIENSFYMSYYAQNTNGTLIKDNEFHSTTKTTSTTRYDIYCASGHTNDTIIGNRFHDPFGTVPTNANQYYGITTYSGNNILIANNRFYNIRSNGDIFSLYINSSPNTRIYHNVLSLDYTASTAGSTNYTYGLNVNSSTPVDFRNNIVSMTRGGSSAKIPVMLNTAGTYTINNNNYYVTGQNAYIGFNNGIGHTNINSWRSANLAFDTSSYTLNPRFVSAADFTSQEAMLNNAGANVLSYVPADANNVARSATPDIGAYEFSPVNTEDAGVVSLVPPAIPFNAGSSAVSARIKNAGTNPLTSVTINWSVNGILQTPLAWTGTLNTAEMSPSIVLGNYTFNSGINHTVVAWTSDPNASTDASTTNDSISLGNIYTTLPGGTYTVNAGASASSTNFTSFTNLSTALSGGVIGPVVVNVVASSGPYTEQVAFNTIPNASVTNNIVINGNGNTLQFNATASNYAQLRLNGAKHMTIQNLTIKALNNTYSWGIHFIANADSNKVINCNIDLTTNISSSTYSAGIVISNSLTSPTTSGSNARGLLISGNTITGSTSGGHYYGITNFPTPDATTPSNNKFINNVIQNFHNMGIYAQYTNGTLYKGNIIRNTNRTAFTTINGIYVVNGSRNDTIINNIIEHPFGATITSTSEFSGIYLNSLSTPAANPNLIANNIIRNVRSNGVQYGIRGSAIGNNRIYHNTIIIDNPTSTSASTTYGIYNTGAPAANGLEIKNNIVYINRPATNTIYNIYLNTASPNYFVNNNAYFKTAAAANVGYYAGTICNTFAQWRAVNAGVLDSAGKFANPYFADITTGTTPRQVDLNAAGGYVLNYVPTDFAGAARSATPDIGAYEFTPPVNDAGIILITPPASPFVAGTLPVNVRIKNGGTATLTSATINWSVNGVAQTPFSWTGSLASGAVSADINIGNGNFVGATNNNIMAWTTLPNGNADVLLQNDTMLQNNIYSAISAGTYTIDKNSPASATNFTSFTSAANSLNLGGITGAVTINMVAGSGPYSEQVLLNNIPGANAGAKVTINGNNQELNFNNTNASILYIIGLNNTKHLVLNNLRIRSLNTANGVGVFLTNSSDSNIIQNCNIDISSITGTSSTTSAGIAFSGSFTSVAATGASTGAANLIQNNVIDGGANTGCYYGIIINATNLASPTYSHNKVIGNTVKDFYNYGIYLAYSTRAAIKNNIISRPTKAAPAAFYGVYVTGGSQADTVENNLIYQPYGGSLANASTVYGIMFSSTAPDVATPSIIKNNVITDFRGAGTIYGISNSTNARIKIYHNTINIAEMTSTSANVTYGIYSTGTATAVDIKNNVVNIEKGGSGAKYALYFNTTSASGYLTNNNSLKSYGGTNANIGYYATAFATIANWKTANSNGFDQNSISANPLFRNGINANFLQPGNDSLDNVGTSLLVDVPFDITGVARTSTPDLGAYDFVTYPNDAGIFSFNDLGGNTSIIIPVSNPLLPVNVTIKNYGTAALTSAGISWEVAGMSQTGAGFTGNLAKGDTAVVNLGIASLGNGINQIKAWTSAPNASTDVSNLNDTLAIRVCTPISGQLTLNAMWPDTGSNFTSFNNLFNALKGCGVSGPVRIAVSAGTYAQQLTMPNNIPGHSSLNQITFDGGDSATCKVVHGGVISRATLLLDGAKNYNFRNMTFIANNAASATAVQLINVADSNTFFKCAFNVPGGTSSTANPFVASGSVTSPTTAGNACNYLYVDSCSTSGGYYGITFYGTTPKSFMNTIKNTRIYDAYYMGAYIYNQNTVRFQGNTIQNMGQTAISSTAYALYVTTCDSASYIVSNHIFNINYSSSVYGIYTAGLMGGADKRFVIGNNTVDVGLPLLNAVYGIYDGGNRYTDFLYNTVRSNSADPSYIYGAFYSANGTPATYQYCRIYNNIFVSPNGSLAINFINQANVIAGLYTIDNNVYYSSNLYPFRVGGFITPTVTNFAVSPQMLGPIGPNNARSLFLMPQFDDNKLKSLSPLLDEAGAPFATLPYDIDSNPRNATIPDIGAYEFTKTQNDAGVAVILNPVKPLVAGLNDIKVVIRNYGLNPLYNCEVGYRVGSTVHTRTYTGNIATLAYDTVVFDATSSPLGGSQQYNFTGGIESIKVWTSMPNNMDDSIPSNDTAYNTLCTGISGVFTINPAGSGPNNFTSVQAALDKLDCGGVYGHVTFEMAPGIYPGQYTINSIAGTSDTSTVTFKSANNNPSSVTFTSAPTATGTNYTIYLRGAKFIRFESVTLENTSASFGRVAFMATNTLTNVTTTNITFRNCIINGQPTTSTADANALIYANAGNITDNLTFVGNTFNNGSMAIWAAGPNIVNQYSANITIDSNTFNNQYYYGLNLSYRSFMKIRKNLFNLPSSTMYSAIYSTLSGAQSVISENTINTNSQAYGVNIYNHAYYNLAGELAIRNNVINMSGGSGTQYGISVSNSSYIDIHNNTVKTSSASSSYAVYLFGHTAFLSGVTNYPSARFYTVKNNILRTESGYALYSANINSDSALITGQGTNRNIYSSGSGSPLFLRTTAYNSANFLSARGVLYPESDNRSRIANIAFTSPTNLKPNESNSSIWYVNGSAERLLNVTNDVTGAARSTSFAEGTPDIGAHEVVPMTEPDNATIGGTIGYGNTSVVLVNGDTSAWITWGFGGALPTAITAKYYPGSYVSHPTQFPTGSAGQVLDEHWKIEQTGGGGFSYDIKLKYDPNHLGTIPSESDIRLAHKDNGSYWIPAGFTSTSLDTLEKTFSTTFLYYMYLYTGTTDIAPLPVKMTAFNVRKQNNDGVLNWATASERNSSRFEVERSEDGAVFVKIGEVKAAGNASMASRYAFTDRNVANQVRGKQAFYRLKIVNRDGSFDYSEIRSISFDERGATVAVYPNPFDGTLSIELNTEIVKVGTITVTDIYGREVLNIQPSAVSGSNRISLDQLSGLANGVYIIRSNINDVEYSHKVIKQ